MVWLKFCSWVYGWVMAKHRVRNFDIPILWILLDEVPQILPEGAMAPFKAPIALRVVRCGWCLTNLEKLTHFFKYFAQKLGAQSVTRLCGNPCKHTNWVTKCCATVLASWFSIGEAHANLVRSSCNVRMNEFPLWDRGKGPTTSRKIFSNALVAVVVITMGSFGIRVAVLFLWHDGHFFTKSLICFLIPFQ